jgi:exosortase family protein XrtM
MKHLALFIKSNAREIRFFIAFILIFFVLQTAYYFARPYTTPYLVDALTTSVSSRIINLITPHEKTFVQDGAITDGAFNVEVRRGCEGVEGMLLLIAAILAFPAGLGAKLTGMLGGVLFIYVFNLARIIGLYYVVKYRPALFDMMHIYVGQIIIIFVALIIFIIWLTALEKFRQQSARQ